MVMDQHIAFVQRILLKSEKNSRFMIRLSLFQLFQLAILLCYNSTNHLLYEKKKIET